MTATDIAPAHCQHNDGFFWSSEGLYRCNLCHASYEWVRGSEYLRDRADSTSAPRRRDWPLLIATGVLTAIVVGLAVALRMGWL